MTSTADSFNDGHGSVVHRAFLLLGHYSDHINIGIIAVYSVRAVYGMWFAATNPAGNVGLATTIAMIVTLYLSLRGEVVHRRSLCLRDINAAPLLDPQGQVDKHRSRLKLIHHPTRHRVFNAAMVLFVAIYPFQDTISTWPVAGKTAGTAAVVAACAVVVYFSVARMTHQRLRPWCPWCQPRGDDDGYTTPAPTPDPVGQNTL